MATRDPANPLREALTDCAAASLTGVLTVTGEPGGTIHLADGRVAAIQTPGAPSPEVILLRSRQLTEATWDAAFAAASAAGQPMCAELVARAVLGAGELEALLRTAVADAMFVLASGIVDDCRTEPAAGLTVDCLLPLEPGAEVGPLLAETTRRMDVLAALAGSAARGRERVVPVPDAVRPGARLGQGQDEILALADGRRTARDMAFALGRGVYATTLRLAQMLGAGVLTTTLADTVRNTGGATPGLQPAPAGEPETVSGLPRRRKGRSALPRRTRDPDAAPDPPAPQRLLRPRSGRNTQKE